MCDKMSIAFKDFLTVGAFITIFSPMESLVSAKSQAHAAVLLQHRMGSLSRVFLLYPATDFFQTCTSSIAWGQNPSSIWFKLAS